MSDSFKIDAEHPWPWLDAFPEYAEQFFNGRDDEKAALFRCVLSAPVTVLFGKSGLGKSSLLQAGLFPQLRGERLLPIYVRLLHDQSAPKLCAQLAKRFSEDIHKTQTAGAASPPLHYRYRQQQEDEDAEPIILTDDLWTDLHRSDIELVDETGKRWQPVFVLDQFEEIFTLGGQNPDRQTHLFLPVGRFAGEPHTQSPGRTPERRRRAVRSIEPGQPSLPVFVIAAVQKTGGELVTPQDAENIVEYLSANQTAGQQKRRGVTQIEPALLGLMCAGLNEDRLRSQTKQLKTDNLTQEGSLIVERFYDQAFAGLPESVRDFVEQHLITNDGVRLAYPVRSVETEKLATAAQLNTLVDKRLLRRESLEEGDRIELVHDRLAQVALRRRQESAQRREVQIQQQKRLRWLVSFAGLLLLITIFAAYMWQSESKAKRAWMEATATRLAIEGSSIIDGSRKGSTVTGLLKVLAGHRLARASNGGEALLDDVLQTEYLKLKQLVYLRESESPFVSVSFSPDGKHIVSSCSGSNALRLWNADTGQSIGQPMYGQLYSVKSVAFSPDGQRIVSGSGDNTLRLWDAFSGQPIGQPLTGHTDWITSVAFSPDGQRIVSGSGDNTLRLWDAFSGQPIAQPLTGHTDWVTSVAFSSDGQRIVSGSGDKTLRLWNANTGQPIGQPLTGHLFSVNSVAFSPDGQRIVSGSEDHTLRLWDAKTGQPIGQPLTGHLAWIYSVDFSPDGKRIVSGSADNTLRLWDAKTGQPIGQPLTGHSNMVNSVAFSPDGQRIVSGSEDRTLRLWDVSGGQTIDQSLSGDSSGSSSVAFSPDGQRIVSGSGDNTLRLWDAFSGQPIGQPLTGHTDWITSVAFSPDGQRIVSGSGDNTLRLWDAFSGQPIAQPLTGHTDWVTSVAFSSDGQRIVSGSGDKTLRLWNANTGQPIGQPLTGHLFSVNSVAFSPDGQRIVSGSEDNTLRLWNVSSGQPVGQPLNGHSDQVFSVAFSPDGQRIVSGSKDYTLRLWDTNTGQSIGQPLVDQPAWIYSVAFSPDGQRIVSGSYDGSLRLWDAITGQPIGQPLVGHSNMVFSVAFSPDGKRIVSGSADKTPRIWPVFEGWADELCKKLGRNMSYKEWRDWVSPDIDYIEQCPGLPIPPDQTGQPVKDPAQATTE